MSKSIQINFFIHPDELKQIDWFFRSNGCLIIKKDFSEEPILYDINISDRNKTQFQVYITREDYKDKIYFKYLPSKGYYYVDVLPSYGIEFSLGGFFPYSDKELHRSRLYSVTEFYDNGDLLKKSPGFADWAKSIMKQFKKQFLIHSSQFAGNLISDKCLEWTTLKKAKLEAGGQKLTLNG